MEVKKVAVLTSGGDCQAMNVTINILVRVAQRKDIKILGVLKGFKGLFDNNFVELGLEEVENISSLGGSILKTSRFPEFKDEKVLDKCVSNIKSKHIDALIIIGGDGSYKGAKLLMSKGVNVICLPGTIDNDLRYTNKCLGFDTAVNNACKFIENVKQTMDAMDRGVVFEVMGRYCGDIALYTASATACDIVAVPEKPVSEKEIIDKTLWCLKNLHRPPTIVIAEKMFDVKELAEKLSKVAKMEIKYSIVGYIQRGGEPSVEDKTLAMQFGVRAIDLLENGVKNRAIGIKDNNVFDVELDKALSAEYNFNYELLNLFYRLNSRV
ncbi:MAG: ATP-dependent 6-phosphofructokinase [Clostridia bacterium]|nr:ATP-dependent 6-phosphofructokinase [Clostridia bacterium]